MNADSSPVAGFWRRLMAYLIDGFVVLGGLGTVLGLMMREQFAALGGWGRLVGLIIAVSYFTIFNSRLQRGQTVGKRVAKIKVESRQGTLLTLPQSFLRACVLCGPYFLYPIADVPESHRWFTSIENVQLVLFGAVVATVYLVVCNRKSRQSLHDLAADTFVVRATEDGPGSTQPIWRGHLALLGCLMAALFTHKVATRRWEPSSQRGLLDATRHAVLALPNVRDVTAQDSVRSFWSSGGTTTTRRNLSVTIVTPARVAEPEEFANRVVQVVLAEYPDAAARDHIGVTLRYGYDIGIATSWSARSFRHTPREWQDLIDQVSAE